jgi:mannose-1-phosphate guanylyltransferase/mannose-1-phosphate guanylyltransferase/mannose-6-phosphate isomerase
VTSPNRVSRPWGHYQVVYQDDNCWAKTLTINSGQSLSLHYHEFRKELWFPLSTGLRGVINGTLSIDLQAHTMYCVPINVLHRLINPTTETITVLEMSIGAVDESDIIRIYSKEKQ